MVYKIELIKHLCIRCQDVLEFGYPSFPAYRLQEKTQIATEFLSSTEQRPVMNIGSIVLYEGCKYEVVWAYQNRDLKLKPVNNEMNGIVYVKDIVVIFWEEPSNQDQFSRLAI